MYLDPDYRKIPDQSKPYCIRCQKPIKNISKAIKVTGDKVNWGQFELGGIELLGADCWKIVSRQV